MFKGKRTYICLGLGAVAFVLQHYPPPFLSAELVHWFIPVCLAGAAYFRAKAVTVVRHHISKH